jgi:site-specific recombinase XerD
MDGMDIHKALESWTLDLRAGRRSPRTIETYTLAVRQLADHLKQVDITRVEEVSRDHIRGFIVEMIETRSPTTAHQRHRSLHHFFKWLVSEGELDRDPMEGLRPPKVEEKPIPVISERGFDLMLKTCDTTYLGRRDEALLRVLWDTGVRISELLSMRAEDVSLDLDLVWVEGKTGTRRVPYTIATARSLDRYLRGRSKHPFADLPDLWLGKRGTMTKSGIGRMLAHRADRAGIGHVHAHMFRHTAADRLLSAGMTEGSVMEILGWSDRSMLDRYGRSVRHRRAIEDYRKLMG